MFVAYVCSVNICNYNRGDISSGRGAKRGLLGGPQGFGVGCVVGRRISSGRGAKRGLLRGHRALG